MSNYVKSLFYFIGSGVIGLAFFAVFQPSEAEIQKIRNFSVQQKGFSAAIETAAKSEEPIYRLSPIKLQSKVHETLNKRE